MRIFGNGRGSKDREPGRKADPRQEGGGARPEKSSRDPLARRPGATERVARGSWQRRPSPSDRAPRESSPSRPGADRARMRDGSSQRQSSAERSAREVTPAKARLLASCRQGHLAQQTNPDTAAPDNSRPFVRKQVQSDCGPSPATGALGWSSAPGPCLATAPARGVPRSPKRTARRPTGAAGLRPVGYLQWDCCVF